MTRANKRQNGFSYLELLLVVAITALVITTVRLTSNDSNRLVEEAERILALQDQLSSEAIFTGAPMVMVIGQDGYDFEVRSSDGWQPVSRKPFVSREVAAPVSLSAPGGCSATRTTPLQNSIRVLMLPDGQRTPFELELCDKDSAIRIRGKLTHAAMEVLPASQPR
ncbi:MAG: GspH/FimT family pseudopilin [Endozoicomonas sp.]